MQEILVYRWMEGKREKTVVLFYNFRYVISKGTRYLLSQLLTHVCSRNVGNQKLKAEFKNIVNIIVHKTIPPNCTQASAQDCRHESVATAVIQKYLQLGILVKYVDIFLISKAQ